MRTSTTLTFFALLFSLAFYQLSESAGATSAGQTPEVLTYHDDNLRSGGNTNETTLNPSNVNVRTFGKLHSFPVDSLVYLFRT